MPRLNRFYVTRDRWRRKLRAASIRPKVRRWPVLLGVMALLLAFPIGAFALRGVIGAPVNEGNNPQAALAFEATIAALYTANAPLGEDADPGQIQTAVAGTLSALETQTTSEQTSTPIPTSWSLWDVFRSETHTSTPTPTIWYYSTNTPTAESGSGGEPPTNTSTPTPEETLEPTATLEDPPEPTSPPDASPTPTPKPVNPSACNDFVGNPNYCTPTPGG